MSKILVTGVSGGIGKHTIHHLLKKGVEARHIIGLSRKKDNLTDLIDTGIEIREGDYFDYNSLLHAFEGVDKLMLTSAVAFTDRLIQHQHVITAAKEAGIKHVVYMAIMRKDGSTRIMPEITKSDLFTEHLLKSSGLDYTILYHPPFTDVLSVYYGTDPYQNGILMPAGDGKMAPATKIELAEAHAEILSSPGHENKTYSLGGNETISFADIADILADITGKPVPFSTITTAQYTEGLIANGTPHKVAEFLTNWVVAIGDGEFEHQSGDLERLLGRKTKTFREYMQEFLSNKAAN